MLYCRAACWMNQRAAAARMQRVAATIHGLAGPTPRAVSIAGVLISHPLPVIVLLRSNRRVSIPRSCNKAHPLKRRVRLAVRIKLRGDLGQNARDIACERTPNFEVKGIRSRAPQRDIRLGKDR